MYENSPAAKQPEPVAPHIQLAINMAKEIALNYTTVEQNEMVKCIRQIVTDFRIKAIEHTTSQAKFLTDSLEDLQRL